MNCSNETVDDDLTMTVIVAAAVDDFVAIDAVVVADVVAVAVDADDEDLDQSDSDNTM